MPDLPITGADLDFDDPEARQAAVHRLGAVMLWPHDAAARKRAVATAGSARAVEIMEFAERNPSLIEAEIEGSLAGGMRAALDGPPPADIHVAARAAYAHGTAAGLILSLALNHDDQKPGGASLKSAKRHIMDMRGIRLGGQSAATIDNIIWARYRPVAHLWGAYLARAVVRDEEDPLCGWTFPCWPLEIEDFLALAERLRAWGEKVRPMRATGAILPPGEGWRVPADIVLPDTRLQWLAPAG